MKPQKMQEKYLPSTNKSNNSNTKSSKKKHKCKVITNSNNNSSTNSSTSSSNSGNKKNRSQTYYKQVYLLLCCWFCAIYCCCRNIFENHIRHNSDFTPTYCSWSVVELLRGRFHIFWLQQQHYRYLNRSYSHMHTKIYMYTDTLLYTYIVYEEG